MPKTPKRRASSRSFPIVLKRIYEAPAKDDGARILVDRLWPRGVSKAKARLDLWLRDIAPSDKLRGWFAHDPKRWAEFKRRYRAELKGRNDELQPVRDALKKGKVTFLFAAHDETHNNAVALKAIIERRERVASKR